MGCQEPTFRQAQEYSQTQGAFANQAMKALGVNLDQWQCSVLDDWLAVNADGSYVHRRCALSVPRQNGKTLLIEARVVTGIALKGESILCTAHDYSTVTMLFDRLKYYFGEQANDSDAVFPELNAMVRNVRKTLGKEAIFLKNGAAVYLSTRTKTAKRGFTVDVFIGDEAQEITEVQAKAMLSAASSGEKKNPQFIYCGTPPDAECNGDILPQLRKEAYENPGNDLSYTEWSAPDVGDIFDIDRWYRFNPALGIRMTEGAFYSNARTYTDPTSFAQESLGYYLPTSKQIEHLVNVEDWLTCQSEPLANGELFFAIKFSPSGKFGVIAACLKPDDDIAPLYVELAAIRNLDEGLYWFEEFSLAVRRGCRRLVIDGGSNAEELHNRLLQARFPEKKLRIVRPKDATTAYAGFVAAIKELKVSHMGQTPLVESVTLTSKRSIGKDGFGFGSTEDADATSAEAVALALWIAQITKRKSKEGAALWVL